jgi:tetratricopeptide (TPR) repeat protein
VRAGERHRRDVLKAVSTVEKAPRATAFAGFSAAALYSVYHGLYSEAVLSSVATAVAFAEVGRFKEAVEYVQRAAKALHEAAREAFEHVKITVQRLVELFIEAVTRMLAWIDEHKAYLFLMAAVAAGVIALSAALNLWGLVELEKLAHAAVGAPFVAGLAETGGKAAERFRAVAKRWRVDDNEKQKIKEIINEVINAHLNKERPYEALRKLSESGNLPEPLAKLKEALEHVKDEAVQDAAVIVTVVLYKTLINTAEAYGEWAELYRWARGLVEKQETTVTTSDIERLRGAHRRLEEAAEEVRRELNSVLASYALHSRDLYERLRPHLEVDVEKAEELVEARSVELTKYSNANMGTKAYAALHSVARGGIYGHAAMLLMGKGALADVVLQTPKNVYETAKRVAKRRGETVDPSRSPKVARAGKVAGWRDGAADQSRKEEVDWEDRAASVLLRFLAGYGEADLKFRPVEREGKKGRVVRGFQVFRTFGSVEAPVGELWIGKTTTRFNVSKEELERLVEEAKRTAPDLSGLDRSRQYLEWRATDVTTSGMRIVAATAHPWQLKWYFSLLGEEKSFSGGADVTKEDIKLAVTAYWPREREDQILIESRWLEQLLGQRVESWRELVDAINWRWVLERVEELTNELKPWIGPERASDAEREGLVRRMLGELALFVHFAEARRGMDDNKWREERIKRLAEAVEALSGGRIIGDHAERLTKLIISYAESRTERRKKRIENLAEEVGISKEEVWGVVKRVLSGEDPYVYCLARDCARDVVVRKFVAPALELIMLDKALNDSNEFDIEEALLIFGEMYATAVAGDGSVGPREVALTVGGELGGGATLLRLATLHLLSQLLAEAQKPEPNEPKLDVRVYVDEGVYNITARSENAARFMRLLAASAPSAGREYLSPKFDQFVEATQVEVRLDNIRQTKRRIAADLTISVGGIAVKYNVYIRDRAIELKFASTDRSRAELAALLLKLAGVNAEVKKVGDVWEIYASTDKLAAGHEELRKALADFVREAATRGWIDAGKAERWLKKLEGGVTLIEGWPKYLVRLDHHGSLEVRFGSTNPKSIEQEAQRLENIGLKRGVHFTVTMPEEGGDGYVRILKEGLAYAAWLSEHSENKQQRRMAAEFVEYILQRAKDACGGKEPCAVYEKAEKIVEEGKKWSSLELKKLKFEKEFEMNGKKYKVKVIGGEAVEEDRGGKLRIKIKVEMSYVEDGYIVRVEREYTITYSRQARSNEATGYAYARADAPGGREADAEILAAVIEALTGVKPWIHRRSDGRIEIICGRKHLDGFMRYKELAHTIKKWLEKTSRRRPTH